MPGKIFEGKRVLITGGTGSLGQVLTRLLLEGGAGVPKKIVVFSRDEAKQHYMRLEYQQKRVVTDEIIYRDFERVLEFRIGDVRDYHAVCAVLRNADIVINAAALKQVPSCEYFPYEAVQTNIGGAENIERVDSLVRRIARQLGLHSETLHEIVALVDERLGRNRLAAERAAA